MLAIFTLRSYQKRLIDDIKASIIHGHKSIVSVLGCGGGKSVIQADISRSATNKQNNVLFLVHRKELCEQIYNTFSNYGVDMELCSVSMVQTVSRHIDRIQIPKIIITDEAHHSTAASYKKIYEAFPDALRLGFTATPCRLNKGGLGEVYDDLITSVSTQWLIENHYLSPYKYYSIPLADTEKLHIRAGEFKAEEVSALIENEAVYSGAVEQYLKLASGKKAIVYCPSVKASKETAEEFNRNGIRAAHLDGTSSKEEREKVIESFRAGKYYILSNADLFSEGFDDKDIECTILLRPTMSLTVFIQQSMRCMRYKEGKTALIIDCVGNVFRHGLPDDDREWSLLPKAKQETTVKIRECPQCYGVYSPTMEKCPYCGFMAVKEVIHKNKKTVSVDLVEIRRQEELKNTRLSDTDFKTWEEVREYQQARKLKFAFCFHYCLEHGIQIPSKYRYAMRYMR